MGSSVPFQAAPPVQGGAEPLAQTQLPDAPSCLPWPCPGPALTPPPVPKPESHNSIPSVFLLRASPLLFSHELKGMLPLLI